MLILSLALRLAGYKRKKEFKNDRRNQEEMECHWGPFSLPPAKQIENRREDRQFIDYRSHIRVLDMMRVYVVVSSLCECAYNWEIVKTRSMTTLNAVCSLKGCFPALNWILAKIAKKCANFHIPSSEMGETCPFFFSYVLVIYGLCLGIF